MNKRQKRTVRASKQLLNYPLSRDRRTRQHWWRSEKTGNWLCNLPADEERVQIQFRLQAECNERLRHCPTAFDMNLLLLVLARTRQTKQKQVNFDSCKAMLQTMGYENDGDGYQRLHDALHYWRELSIRYLSCWYDLSTKKSKETKRLPPPFLSFSNKQGHRISIDLDPQWETMQDIYFGLLKLPLPRSAAACNMVMWLAAWGMPAEVIISEKILFATLYRKIGLLHSTRSAQLKRTITEVQTYYRDRWGLEMNSESSVIGDWIRLYWERIVAASPTTTPHPKEAVKRVQRVERVQRKERVTARVSDEPYNQIEPEWERTPCHNEDGVRGYHYENNKTGDVLTEIEFERRFGRSPPPLKKEKYQ
jgi:hypothetical protein